MLPMNRFQQLPQNKLAGLNVAYGRAIYVYPEETGGETDGFVFEAPESFQLTVDPAYFKGELNLSMEVLMDCIDQVEEQLGQPEQIADQYGIAPRSGYESIGLTVRSRIDDRVVCSFVPANFEWETENWTWPKKVQGFFSWYLQDRGPSMDLSDLILDKSMQDGGASVSTLQSPIIPSYEAAAAALEHMDRSRTTQFLDRLWLYERAFAPGIKIAEEPWLKAAWKALSGDLKLRRRA